MLFIVSPLHFAWFVSVHFSFSGMRSSLVNVCLFPHDRCYLLYPLCILLGLFRFILVFPAWEVLWLMFVSYLIADVIHCTVLLPGSLAISISLRFCRFLVYQCVLFSVTGVLSHCYTFSLKLLLCFSFPGMTSSLVCLFPHDRCYSLLALFPAREVFFVVAS